MGNLDLAIVDFTKAIELDPRMSNSFYGRSVIERNRGDEVRANSDLAAAKAIESDIERSLARAHIWPQ